MFPSQTLTSLTLGMRIEACRHGPDAAVLKKAADLRGSPAADFWRDEAFHAYEAGFNGSWK